MGAIAPPLGRFFQLFFSHICEKVKKGPPQNKVDEIRGLFYFRGRLVFTLTPGPPTVNKILPTQGKMAKYSVLRSAFSFHSKGNLLTVELNMRYRYCRGLPSHLGYGFPSGLEPPIWTGGLPSGWTFILLGRSGLPSRLGWGAPVWARGLPSRHRPPIWVEGLPSRQGPPVWAEGHSVWASGFSSRWRASRLG